jgi:hypothetical protein
MLDPRDYWKRRLRHAEGRVMYLGGYLRRCDPLLRRSVKRLIVDWKAKVKNYGTRAVG